MFRQRRRLLRVLFVADHQPEGGLTGRKPDPSKGPILVLPGLLGSTRNWGSVGRMIATATGRSVYVMDLRNQGKSPHEGSMDFELMAGDVEETVESVIEPLHRKITGWKGALRDPVLLGHSLGGKVAAQAALSGKLPLEGLIIADISTSDHKSTGNSLSSGGVQAVIGAMGTVDVSSLRDLKEANQALLDAGITDSPQRQFVMTNLIFAQQPGEETRWQVNLPVITERLGDLMGPVANPESACDRPALLIYGGDSEFVNPERDVPLMQKQFSSLTATPIPGAGHMLHISHFREFTKLVDEFLLE